MGTVIALGSSLAFLYCRELHEAYHQWLWFWDGAIRLEQIEMTNGLESRLSAWPPIGKVKEK